MHIQRKHKRRHLIYYLRVFDTTTGQIVGHLVDITPEGVMLMSEEPLPVDQDFNLRMAVPQFPGDKKDLRLHAQSIWCKQDINPDFYVTGFRLSNVSDQDLDYIQSLVEEFGFPD